MIFNSALLYETALLKPYVEPLLFAVPKDCEEYIEAKRLLKFLSYFLPVPADDVPRTSLLRSSSEAAATRVISGSLPLSVPHRPMQIPRTGV